MVESSIVLEIERFPGREATVNSYIVHNQTSAIVVDCLRNREEASELAQKIPSSGFKLQAIFATHGHPDHYIGARTLKEEFPQARILVASTSIKADMAGFSSWMESVGWLDKQPQMKPKGAARPDGFDYESQVNVMTGDRLELDGGGVLTVRSDYPPTECGHMTTLFAPSLNTLLTGDLTYHGVHAWAGQGVQREHIANWVRALGDLKASHSDPATRVLPGHGPPSDPRLVDDMRVYLDDFLSDVDSEPTDTSATERMKRLYPGFEQDGFLLARCVAFHGPDARRRSTGSGGAKP
ncbi:MAG: MBL fold metallo-hydrolase [Thermoplasmata archaeon]|jgi:glyoxylase-like metal-dependent hydrolase (beta-lactamase superfamily II)|nr:MBL fold metallo-hydrolase [Thermoplasmata archaeon]